MVCVPLRSSLWKFLMLCYRNHHQGWPLFASIAGQKMQRPPPVPNPDYEVWSTCIFSISLCWLGRDSQSWESVAYALLAPLKKYPVRSTSKLSWEQTKKVAKVEPLLLVLPQGVRSRTAASCAPCALAEQHYTCSLCSVFSFTYYVGQGPAVVWGCVNEDSQTNISAVPTAHPERPAGSVCRPGIQGLLKFPQMTAWKTAAEGLSTSAQLSTGSLQAC